MKRCDFCGLPGGMWKYPCADFDVDAILIPDKGSLEIAILLESTSSWIACYLCSMYIDRQDYYFLAKRCKRTHDEMGLTRVTENHYFSLFQAFERFRIKEQSKKLL